MMAIRRGILLLVLFGFGCGTPQPKPTPKPNEDTRALNHAVAKYRDCLQMQLSEDRHQNKQVALLAVEAAQKFCDWKHQNQDYVIRRAVQDPAAAKPLAESTAFNAGFDNSRKDLIREFTAAEYRKFKK